ILAAIRALNRERGLTVVLVTHEATLGAMADRMITMSDGLIVSDERKAQHVAAEAPGDAGSVRPASLLSDIWSFGAMALLAAGRGIGRNKLRSALTMLGIFIGVAALIAMLAVGEGARAALKAQLESLGTDLLVVLPGSTRANGVRAGIGSASTLRATD